MSGPVEPDNRPRTQRWGEEKPDPFGRNIPPNERVIRREPWQPEFTPLGETPSERPTQVEDHPSAPQPFSPPQEPAWIEPAHPGRRHRHAHRQSWSPRCTPFGGGFPWIFIVLVVIALGWMGNAWWLLFLLWPLGFFRGMRRSPSTLGVILIAAGVLIGLSTLGLSAALALPLLLIAGGLMVLFRTLQAPSRI